MFGNIVKLTQDISFEDLNSGRIHPIDVYELLVKSWILEPAEIIAAGYPENTDHGMALLGIELMFFEPHGQFLTGKTSNNRAKQTFSYAFDDFREFLEKYNLISSDTSILTSESIFKWARCGLFHSGRLSDELLVDAIDYTSNCLEKNKIFEGWLIDPWKLLPAMKLYLYNYTKALRNGNNKSLNSNFNKTFDKLIRNSMERYINGPDI